MNEKGKSGRAKATNKVVPRSTGRGSANHAKRITMLEKDVKALRSARGRTAFALTADAGITTAVTFEWSPTGAASWVKVDGQKLGGSPTTLQLAPGTHVLEYTFTGAPKTPWRIVVTGAKFPTAPITGSLPDDGFVAGYCYVLV